MSMPAAASETPTLRSLTRARRRAVQQVVLVSSVLNLGYNSLAHAVLGQALMSWAATNLIAPIGLIAVVIAIGGALFRPEMVSKALYAALICVVLFFIINASGTVIQNLQAG